MLSILGIEFVALYRYDRKLNAVSHEIMRLQKYKSEMRKIK
jgi:hypothetical protein